MDRQALGTASIVRANSRDLPLPDDSVDLVVTSPPYFALRSYQDTCPACRDLERTGDGPREAFPDWSEHTRKFHHYAGQIGDEPTPAEFVESLLEVTRECVRVLKPSGSLWVNLGDKYAQSASQWQGSRRGHCGDMAGTKADEASRFGQGSWNDAPDMAARPKSLIGIPWRYALRCIDDLGLILRAEVIWSKPNGLPESVTDRVRRSHETWFHFTLQPRYFSAVDEIREGYQPTTLARNLSPRAVSGPSRGAGANVTDRAAGHEANPLGKLPGSVWTVPTQPLRVPESLGVDHFAAFPMEFPRRIIKGWAPTRGVCVECGEGRRPVVATEPMKWKPSARAEAMRRENPDGLRPTSGTMLSAASHIITGEACACPEPTAPTRPAVVLDPFGGTGTTALVAKALGCHGISVDMSADYCRLAQWRTNDEAELARALQVEKPAKQVDGQGSLLELIEEEAS